MVTFLLFQDFNIKDLVMIFYMIKDNGKESNMLEVISEELRQYHYKKLAEYEQKNARASKEGIVFTGDSLIEFYPLTKYFGTKLPLHNRGIAGTDSQWLYDHCDTQVNALEPDQVFILIGCNDIGLGFELSHIVKTIVDLINRIRSHSIYTTIHLLSLLPVSKNPQYQQTVKLRTNEVIDAINQELAMIPAVDFIDLNSMLKDENGGLADHYTLDGLHLNGLAYETISKRLGQSFSIVG